MTVDFITFCCPKDWERLYAGLGDIVRSHKYEFDHIYVLRQHLAPEDIAPIEALEMAEIDEIDVDDDIIGKYISLPDEQAEKFTGPPNRAHYWKNHCMNHLTGMEVSDADYIVFQDADCTIISEKEVSWVTDAIKVMKKWPQAIMATPNWGSFDGTVFADDKACFVETVSQQIFLIKRSAMLAVDWAIPWDWEYLAPYGPMQEFYYMLEGRLWRWMHKQSMVRAVLRDHRYWHHQW